MTTRQLKKRVADWQVVLGLSEWKIDAKFVKKTEIKNAIAETGWQPEWKEATVHFRSSAYIKLTGRSVDHFIVHELLHLLLEGHREPRSGYDPLYEAAINVIADLLIMKYNSKV